MTGPTPRGLLAPAPPERLAALRVLVVAFAVGYLLVRFPHLVQVARLAETSAHRYDPVGPMVLVHDPVPEALAVATVVLTVLVGLAALAGWRWRLSGGLFAVGVLAVLSYRNSWGQIFHTENLLVLHLGILALAPAADAWSLDARRRRQGQEEAADPAPSTRYGWPAQLMVLVVVVAYVLAGWAKLRASGIGWVDGEALRNLVAHDALRKVVVGDSASPIGRWMVGNDWLFAPLAALALVVELAAVVVLLGGRWRVGWVAAAWLFHLGVLAVMGIMFPYQVFGVAFACCFCVEVLPHRWRWAGGSGATPALDRANLSS